MSVSIIWKLSEKEKENQITFENIREQIAENKQSVQILIYANACDNGKKYGSGLEQTGAKTQLCAYEGTDTEIYADAQEKVTGSLVTFLYGGDRLSQGTFAEVEKSADTYPEYNIFMLRKKMPDGTYGAFATDPASKKILVINLLKKYYCHPFYFGGTIFSACSSKSAEYCIF